jgi:uncharacterized protein (DUF1778 family)
MSEATRTTTINLRIAPERLTLIDRAAEIRGLTRTDFILQHAQTAAEETILDRTLFQLDPERFAAFAAALDAPTVRNEALDRLLSGRSAWE